MIKRIVKLTLKENHIQDFLDNFETIKSEIRNFEGNMHLELLQDIEDKNVFFTYSFWENTEALENYRKSAFFNEVWKYTKTLFANKAEAWSVDSIDVV